MPKTSPDTIHMGPQSLSFDWQGPTVWLILSHQTAIVTLN